MSEPLGDPFAIKRPPTPRWVKGFGIAILVLVVMVVALHLSGNSPAGSHSLPSAAPDGQTSHTP